MTRVKQTFRWLVPTVALLVFALLFVGLPVHAAEGAPEEDGSSSETEASVTFTAGELKLLAVPVLEFGSHPVSATEQQYQAVSVSPNVLVSDLRGNGGGWELMVSLSPFQLNGDGGLTLKAASIHIANPTVSAVNGNLGTPPIPIADITLTSDGTETPVLKAGTGEGMGVWALQWNAADTTLIVKPGTAQEGHSLATLNWSLHAAP